jgi:hypothetical protein
VKGTTLTTLILYFMISSYANAHECKTYETPLVDLLNQYSEAFGTQFVVDPRVRANVNLVGVDTESINTSMLIGILNIHGFTALTSDEVVYVMPYPVAEASGDTFGVTWEG